MLDKLDLAFCSYYIFLLRVNFTLQLHTRTVRIGALAYEMHIGT